MTKSIESGISAKLMGTSKLSAIKDAAINLGIKGIAFIKEDGSIKVIAEGEEKNLEKFAKRIERIFFFSSIENFYILWKDFKGEFSDFSISY